MKIRNTAQIAADIAHVIKALPVVDKKYRADPGSNYAHWARAKVALAFNGYAPA